MENEYVAVEFNSSIDSETEFISCEATIILMDIDTNVETEIGSANLYLINVFKQNSWFDVVFSADEISADLHNIVVGLTDIIDEKVEFFGLLAILDRIHIYERFRGKGYGSKSITEIIKYLKVLNIDYLALSPSPLEEKEEQKKKEGVQGLIKFYEQFDLRVVSDESDSVMIMGKDLHYL